MHKVFKLVWSWSRGNLFNLDHDRPNLTNAQRFQACLITVKRKSISSWPLLSMLDNCTRFSIMFDEGQEKMYFFLTIINQTLTNVQGFQACLIMVKRRKIISLWPWSSKFDKCTGFSSLLDHGQEEINFFLSIFKHAWQLHKVFELAWSSWRGNYFHLVHDRASFTYAQGCQAC